MTFYIHGKVYVNETKPMITFFGTWAFDKPKYLILNLALGGIYPYKMTGVTAPYYGMSQRHTCHDRSLAAHQAAQLIIACRARTAQRRSRGVRSPCRTAGPRRSGRAVGGGWRAGLQGRP
jgi:hypothetical protein